MSILKSLPIDSYRDSFLKLDIKSNYVLYTSGVVAFFKKGGSIEEAAKIVKQWGKDCTNTPLDDMGEIVEFDDHLEIIACTSTTPDIMILMMISELENEEKLEKIENPNPSKRKSYAREKFFAEAERLIRGDDTTVLKTDFTII